MDFFADRAILTRGLARKSWFSRGKCTDGQNRQQKVTIRGVNFPKIDLRFIYRRAFLTSNGPSLATKDSITLVSLFNEAFMYLRNFLLLSALSMAFLACSDKGDDEAASAPAPTEVTVFRDWMDHEEVARSSILKLIDLSEEAETLGTVPSFFKNGALMSREDRDNLQNGYVYPLYFVDRTRNYPSRQWEDGYTVRKDRASDQDEGLRIEKIKADLIDYWTEEIVSDLFRYLTQYPLIDVRHYSLKKNPPTVSETCFTVAFKTHKRGGVNYCYNSHRMLENGGAQFPQVTWSMNPSSMINIDAIEAFKLFVVALASHEVIFDNQDNRELREMFLTNQRLSAQMHEANQKFDQVFQYFIDEQRYLNGRQ